MALLINIEGIDGSGKSTLATALAAALGATLTTEPTRGPYGTLLRKAFAEGRRLPREEERRMFEDDRRHHMASFVRVRLAAGETIVSDRSYYSSAAYQGTTEASAIAIVRDNEAFASRPDIVMFLDIPSPAALNRIQARGTGFTAMENLDNLEDCERRYEAIWATPDLMNGLRFVRLDAMAPPETILRNALDAVRSFTGACAACGDDSP